jgi:hypothetical protein
VITEHVNLQLRCGALNAFNRTSLTGAERHLEVELRDVALHPSGWCG